MNVNELRPNRDNAKLFEDYNINNDIDSCSKNNDKKKSHKSLNDNFLAPPVPKEEFTGDRRAEKMELLYCNTAFLVIRFLSIGTNSTSILHRNHCTPPLSPNPQLTNRSIPSHSSQTVIPSLYVLHMMTGSVYIPDTFVSAPTTLKSLYGIRLGKLSMVRDSMRRLVGGYFYC